VNSLESKDITNIISRGIEADYAATVAGAGVCILDNRKIVRVIGDDRVTFFHGMCSADVKNAAPGTILPALILTEHAHVIAELFIWVMEDALLLDIDADAWTRARAHLERLLVADDVEFEDELELPIVDVEGPEATAVIQIGSGVTASLEKAWSHNGKASSSIERLVGNMQRFGAPALSLIVPTAGAASVVARMIEQVPGARMIEAEILEIIRVENGIAKVGVDTTDKTIALEARLNRAISFNKGCYVGQETIERATARGGLKKRLLGLRLENTGVPERGAIVSLQSKEVGRVSSAVRSPRFGVIALAILHHSAWTPGIAVTIGESGEATVSDLPFA
jgi:folate-binding protein YgfZ